MGTSKSPARLRIDAAIAEGWERLAKRRPDLAEADGLCGGQIHEVWSDGFMAGALFEVREARQGVVDALAEAQRGSA